MRRLIIALFMAAMIMSVVTGCSGSKGSTQTEIIGSSQDTGPINDGDVD